MKKRLFLLFLLSAILVSSLFPVYAAEPSTENAEGVLLYCFHTDSILLEKNADQSLAVGNTAQLMTTLLTLEAYPDLTTEVTLTDDLLPGWYAEGDYRTLADYGFHKGATLPVKDLLAATVIENANCSSLLLASLIAGSRSAFVERMNARAQELGMLATVYQNPTGADAEGGVTTARDLLILAKALYENPDFMALASRPSYTLSASRFTVYTRNYFIGKWYTADYLYEYANGMKAGYTDESGYTLLATATERDGYSYLAIILGGKEVAFKNTAYALAKSLFQWGSSSFSYREILSSAKLITTLPVENGDKTRSVSLFPKESLNAYLPKALDPDAVTVSYTLNEEKLIAPFEKGTEVGTVTVSYQGDVIGSTPLITGNGVTRSQDADLRDFLIKALKTLLVAMLILIAVLILRICLKRYRKKQEDT